MKLKEILDLKAGTLIKGLAVTSYGKQRLCVDGWQVSGSLKNNKSDESALPRGQYVFTYYKDKRVTELIKKKRIQVYKPGPVKYSVLKHNGESYYKDIKYYFEQEVINEGDCLGMSLGRSFIAIQPTHVDVYRPDFYEIYVFHNILCGEKSRWIVLQSMTQYKGLLVIDPDQVLLDIHMDLL